MLGVFGSLIGTERQVQYVAMCCLAQELRWKTLELVIVGCLRTLPKRFSSGQVIEVV